jgi:hypothetical protein
MKQLLVFGLSAKPIPIEAIDFLLVDVAAACWE